METLLMFMLFLRSTAVVVGIAAFTLMCLIGVIIAVDEIRHKLGLPVYELQAHRREAKHRKVAEDEEWAKFWTAMDSGFENTGEIKAREYVHPVRPSKTAWFRDVQNLRAAERIRNDFPE